MDANVYPSPLPNAVREDGPPLETLLLYEDLPTALRAKHLLDRLTASPRLQLFTPAKAHLLRLDVLSLSLLEDEASGSADLVMVSLHGDTELSSQVQGWLREWNRRRDREPLALVLLLDEQARDSFAGQRILSFLRDLTEDLQLELFCEFCGDPAFTSRETKPRIAEQASGSSRFLEGSLHRPDQFRGWGINE
jgi:hypothetical protein